MHIILRGFVASYLSLAVSAANAQIATDGTMGAIQSLAGTSVDVLETLGTRQGDNLFHSFSTFSVSSGQTVTFTGSDDIQNVISRVTGSDVSTIDGVLASQVGSANFFFLNPNGIVVAEGAQIDVPAGIYLSSAHSIAFADGNSFSADAADNTLSIESPASFGFLANSNDVEFQSANISITSPKTIHVSGANISMNDSLLIAHDSHVDFTAVGGSAADVSLDSPTASAAGSIDLNYSLISTPGVSTGGGSINLAADDLHLVDSLLEINTTGSVDADANSGINIFANNVTIDDSTGQLGLVTYTGIDNLTADSGSAADISIDASGTVQINDGASVTSASYAGSGNGGNISIRAGQIVVAGSSEALFPAGVYSYAADVGNSGDITLAVGSISLVGNSTIDGSSEGSANAAAINIQSNQLTLTDGATLKADTTGLGDAGSIQIDTTDLTLAQGSSVSAESGVFLFEIAPGEFVALSEADGNAGSITINAEGAISIESGSKVSAASVANGSAGSLTVNSSSLEINGDGADAFTGLSVESATLSSGAAGQILVDVSGDIEMYQGASMLASSVSDAAAGSIIVTASNLTMDHQSASANLETAISSQGLGAADGGNVSLDIANHLQIDNGAQVDTNTFGTGMGGDVLVSAGSISMNGGANPAGTGIGSQTQGDGDAGSVTVNVDGSLSLANAAQITSDTFDSGKAGDVVVTANDIQIDGASTFEVTGITSLSDWDQLVGNQLSDATGDAGKVSVTAAGSIMLANNGTIATKVINGASGDAGSVEVQAANIELVSGGQINSSSFNVGNGGDVAVTTDELTIDGYVSGISAQVFSSTTAGKVGNINLNVSGDVSINQGSVSVSSFSQSASPAALEQGEIVVSANELRLTDTASINASSFADVPASNVSLAVSSLVLDDAAITTSAVNANGGAVSVGASNNIVLRNSLVTTSVFGTGNGGDITVDAPIMLMDTGFIQANTAGTGSSGGEINVETDAIVPSFGEVLVGGSERYQFDSGDSYTQGVLPGYGQNVIQAAAPDGINGNVVINAPEVDLSAELTVAEVDVLNLNDMDWSPCAKGRNGNISIQGRGGLKATPDQPGLVPLAAVTSSASNYSEASEEMFAFQSHVANGGCGQ